MLRPASPRHWLVAPAIAAMFFCAAAPTLTWLEFASGIENLVVAAALELHRPNDLPGGRESTWLMPTLAGEPRIAKPPLATWIAAASVKHSTLQRIDSPDPAVRDAAYRELAWQMRWPALLCACLTLLATYELGRIVGGTRVAIFAALAHGTTYAFLRFSHSATTDVQLALWVAVANVGLAHALICGRRWVGLGGAAVALALAFMSKGPVGVVQTVAPALAFVAWRAWAEHRVIRAPRGFAVVTRASDQDIAPTVDPSALPPFDRQGSWLGPVVLAILIFMGLAAPWFIAVARQFKAWDLWWNEVMRRDVTGLPPNNPFTYVTLFSMAFPWTIFLIGGLILGITGLINRLRRRLGGKGDALVLMVFLLLVPVLVMTCFRDRKERYLLPMMSPAAVLVAAALAEHRRAWCDGRATAAEKMGVVAHWACIAAVGLLFPLAGALGKPSQLTTITGAPWFAPAVAAVAAAACLAALVAGMVIYARRRTAGLVGATVLVMLVAQWLFAYGYRNSTEAISDLRPFAYRIRQQYPALPVWSYRPGRRAPEDLAIYLNRTVRTVEFHPDALSEAFIYPEPRPLILVIFAPPDDPRGLDQLLVRQRGPSPTRGGRWVAYCLPPLSPSTRPTTGASNARGDEK